MNLKQTVSVLAILMCGSGLLAAQPLPLTIVDEPLPPIQSGVEFHVLLRASGGVPPYVWSVSDGDLPDGVTLTPEGLLSGRPAKPGEFDFSVRVEDSGRPARAWNKEFEIAVAASLLLEWLQPPKVHEDRIEGSVQLSNGTKDAFDLTVVIVAVAENGRATAIGYEHFPLKPGANNVPIQFGNTLPPGGYVIHADAIAEIPTKQAILRQRLETPQPLQIIQGP
jgi:hypothetical protein